MQEKHQPKIENVLDADRERLRKMIQERAVLKAPDHLILDLVGHRRPWMIDMRNVFLDGAGLDLVSDIFWDIFADFDELQIAGLELGAVPLIAGLVLKGQQRGKRVNGLVVRRSRKKYGRAKRIEGPITSAPIVVVDDLANSSASFSQVCFALRDENLQPNFGFVFTKYREATAEIAKRAGIEIMSLFGLGDFGLELEPQRAARRFSSYSTAWAFETPIERNRFEYVVPKSNPVVAEDRIFFGTDARVLYALDTCTGKKIWEHRAGQQHPEKGIWSTPAISGHRVIYGAYDGNLYCLDTATGQPIWTNQEADFIGSSPAIAQDLGLVYVGMEFAEPGRRGSLFALDVETGTYRWSYDVREFLHGSPIYSAKRNKICFGTNDRTIVALDARTGRELWVQQCRGEVKLHGSFGPDDLAVAFASHDGHVYVLETDTGRPLHSLKGEFSFFCSPLIVGDFVIAGNLDKSIYISNYRTGELVQRIETDARIFATPALIDGRVFIGNNSGAVFEIDPDTWTLCGRYQLPDRVLSAVAEGPGGLKYALTGDGRLFAYRWEDKF